MVSSRPTGQWSDPMVSLSINVLVISFLSMISLVAKRYPIAEELKSPVKMDM